MSEAAAARGALARAATPVAGVLLAAAYATWTWSRELGEFGGDNAYYVLTAEYIASFGAAGGVAERFATTSLFPPLYPLALALAGGAHSLLAAHLATTAMLLAAFAVLHAWLRRLDFAPAPALLATLAFALLPGTVVQALELLSESLYVLWSLLALCLATRWETARRARDLWLAAACIGAAALTRSVAITLIAAWLLWLAVHRPPRFLLLALAGAAPFVAWSLAGPGQGGGYLAPFLERMTSPAAIVEHVAAQGRALWQAWTGTFTTNPLLRYAVIPVTAACAVGAVLRIRARTLDGAYVLAYLGLMVVWPFPAEAARFLFVIVPVALVHGLVGLRAALAEAPRAAAAGPTALALVLLLLAAPDLARTVDRFATPLDPALERFRRDRTWYTDDAATAALRLGHLRVLTDAMRRIADHVPDDACVYSIKPSVVAFHSRRLGAWTPGPALDDAAFDRALEAGGCRHVFSIAYASPLYPGHWPRERVGARLREVDVANAPEQPVAVAVLAELTSAPP